MRLTRLLREQAIEWAEIETGSPPALVSSPETLAALDREARPYAAGFRFCLSDTDRFGEEFTVVVTESSRL